VVLLLALDCSQPPRAEIATSSSVDRSIIRIHSARAWPEKIIFDTSTRIATAVSSPLLATERPDDHASQTFAMAGGAEAGHGNHSRISAEIVRATNPRSKRTSHSRPSRLSDRHVMVGAFWGAWFLPRRTACTAAGVRPRWI